MPFGSFDVLMSLWLPLAVGAFAAVGTACERAEERRHAKPFGPLVFKPKRALLLAAPLIWQMIAHASDGLLSRLVGVVMVMAAAMMAGMIVSGLVTRVLRFFARE